MIINGSRIGAGNSQAPAENFVYAGALTPATTTAVGGMLKLQNDTGVDLIITDAIVDITTIATGVSTMDLGVDDGGDVSNDSLLDAVDVHASTGILDNRIDKGTNGGMTVWKKNEYVVGTASATTAGLVATYKIKAIAR